jgi:epoxide hydrolase 4
MIENKRITTYGVNLNVALSGPAQGAPVVLLHGFPEAWFGWRKQIDALAEAGYRVIAPDQCGYNLSDKPRGLDPYRINTLAADMVGLMRALGYERAAVVGHDWGGLVAWWLALQYPQVVERLVILNAPHPAVAVPQALRHPSQMLRSLYIFFFQLPRLPEWALCRDGYVGLVNLLRASSKPGTFGDAQLQDYIGAWSQPGAVTAMLNWYRALVRRPATFPASPRVSVPALMLWGAQDIALDRSMAPASIDLCDNGRLVFFEQASHWLQHEEPERVNTLLLDFLKRS